MKCPRCSNETLSKIPEENQGYGCSRCDGIWLTKENLLSIRLQHNLDISLLRAQLIKDKRSDGLRNCPNCSQGLVTSTICEIELDWCASCDGIWFDPGEFSGMVTNTSKETMVDKVFGTVTIVEILATMISGLT